MSDHPLQEVEIPFNGKTYRIRPSFSLVARIERALGPAREIGIRTFAAALPYHQRQGIKEIGVTEFATCLGLILMDQKGAPEADQIGEILMQKGGFGSQALMSPVGDLLCRMVQGNEEYERDARQKAEEAEKERAKGEVVAGDAAENPPKATPGE